MTRSDAGSEFFSLSFFHCKITNYNLGQGSKQHWHLCVCKSVEQGDVWLTSNAFPSSACFIHNIIEADNRGTLPFNTVQRIKITFGCCPGGRLWRWNSILYARECKLEIERNPKFTSLFFIILWLWWATLSDQMIARSSMQSSCSAGLSYFVLRQLSAPAGLLRVVPLWLNM